MNLFMSDAAAIKRVQSLGLRVVNPADPPDLAEAQRTLLSNGFYVAGPSDPPDLARARKMLEAAGMRVMANHRRIPAAGSKWARYSSESARQHSLSGPCWRRT